MNKYTMNHTYHILGINIFYDLLSEKNSKNLC
jgi:hypothetical protein